MAARRHRKIASVLGSNMQICGIWLSLPLVFLTTMDSPLVFAGSEKIVGGSQAATVGALFCAQGANASYENQGDAAAYYANCQQHFNAAKSMQAYQKQAIGFTPDPTTLTSNPAQKIMQEFERKFGISSTDYFNAMLAPDGGRDALPGILGGKVPDSVLAEAFARANELAAAGFSGTRNELPGIVGTGGSQQVNLPKRPLKNRDDSSAEQACMHALGLEAARRKQAAIIAAASDPTSPRTRSSAAESHERDVNIFSIIHRKYVELTKRLRL